MNSELYQMRCNRLKKLLALDAPESVIKVECALVLRSLAGGTRLSVIRYLVKDLIVNWFQDLKASIEFCLCKLNIYHSYMEMLVDPGGESDETKMICPFCDRAKGK